MWCALELKGQLQKYSPVTKHGSLRQNQIFVSNAQESTLKSTPLTMGVATGGGWQGHVPPVRNSGRDVPQKS